MRKVAGLLLVELFLILIFSFVSADNIYEQPYAKFGLDNNEAKNMQSSPSECNNPLIIKGSPEEIIITLDFFFNIPEKKKIEIKSVLLKENNFDGKEICDVQEFFQLFNTNFELGISDNDINNTSNVILKKIDESKNNKTYYDDNIENNGLKGAFSTDSFASASYYQPFSEKLIGDTFVILIFSDWGDYTWSNSKMDESIGITENMISWMEGVAPSQANLNMYGMAYHSFSTTEPKSQPEYNLYVWGDEAVRNLGYSDLNGDGSAIDDMMEEHRDLYSTDNVFIIFLSYMEKRSYAYGDITNVFAIDSCGWIFCSLEEFPIYAHESLHLFGAQDEYYQSWDDTGCHPYSCTNQDKWGYINGNCENPECGLSSVPCIMKDHRVFGSNSPIIEYYSRGQIGWGDHDGDLDLDPLDNCMWNYNPYQENIDGDSLGNVCDNDDDNDLVIDSLDNCPFNYNPNQSNTDGDSFGDVCDLDDDNDGILDTQDNCPSVYNLNQQDLDNDNIGDVCDNQVIDLFIDNGFTQPSVIHSNYNGVLSVMFNTHNTGNMTLYIPTQIYIDNILFNTIPSLPFQNGTRLWGVGWVQNTNLSVGLHNFRVLIDPQNQIKETNETNNEFSYSFYVYEPLDIFLVSPNQNIYFLRSIQFNLTTDMDVDELSYIDFSDSKPREIRLCINCNQSGYSRRLVKSFNDGYHNLSFIARQNNTIITKNISFLVDTIKPRIVRTSPTRGFSNGVFNVEFREDNPRELILYYGNSVLRSKNISINQDCVLDRTTYKCQVSTNLSEFNGQQISYWFSLKDIAGNQDTSRVNELDVDLTPPILNNPNSFWTQGTGVYRRYIYFNFNITEPNFDEVDYIDWDARTPRQTRLCSNMRNGVCSTRKSFSSGSHNLTITILDDAGNSITKNIGFVI